jgi:GNAT superfamily N-acetyltransferase
MHGPVSADEMARAEQFFHTRGAMARIDLCPLADPSLVTWLNAQGYQLAAFKNVWVLTISDGDVFPPPPESLTVRLVDGSQEKDLWVRTVSQGFTGQETLAPEDLVIARPSFHMSTATPFLAWLDGEPAGGATMATYQGLAAFFSASTRPAFRGRGVQTALLHARLEAAAAMGCDLVTVQTTPGSSSQRNVERLGFRLAYTKPTLVRAAK